IRVIYASLQGSYCALHIIAIYGLQCGIVGGRLLGILLRKFEEKAIILGGKGRYFFRFPVYIVFYLVKRCCQFFAFCYYIVWQVPALCHHVVISPACHIILLCSGGGARKVEEALACFLISFVYCFYLYQGAIPVVLLGVYPRQYLGIIYIVR